MPSSNNGDGHPSGASERTPLLGSSDLTSNGSEIRDGDLQAAQVAEQVEGGPAHPPGLPKTRSYPNNEVNDNQVSNGKNGRLTKFGKDGKLEGVGKFKFRCILGGVLLGYTITMFDSTLMASSHPVITSYFNASNSASWLSTSFLLTSTSLQPLMGRLSDTFGRRPLYLVGLVLLTVTTAWCALAQSIESFIMARAFCGIGAAGVLSQGNIIVNDLVSIEVRGTYQAYINLFYGGGSACGAAFGGFLCDKLGWRMTFALQIPILLLLSLNALFSTPSSLGPNLAKSSGMGARKALQDFDTAGSILLTASVAFLILGLNLGGNVFPWKHPFIITSLIVALATGILLIRVEARAARAVMPLSMMFSQPRGNLVFNNFFGQIGMNTILFNAPLYFQAVKLESASMSGFRLAGPSLALTVCGVSAGFIMSATGRLKWLIVLGSFCMLLGATCLASMWDGIPTWLATIFLIPTSVGQGLSFPACSIGVLATSTQENQAVMSSTLSLWRNLGIVMGVSISSLVLQNALSAYLQALVTGDNKREIINQVRKSVRSIIDLDPTHQAQVISAYKLSLRLVFISAIAVFVIVNALTVAITLPDLKQKQADEEAEAEEEGVSASAQP